MMRFLGATLDQYDQVIGKMGFEHDGAGAEEGGVFHWVAKTDDGLLVVDVWESDAHFEAFAKEQIMPITQEVGVAEPEITRYEVYNTRAAPRFLASVSR